MNQGDPLEPLGRMRRMALDQARTDLADSLRAEEHAAAALARIVEAIRRETGIACSVDGSAGRDADQQTFFFGQAAREAEGLIVGDLNDFIDQLGV